MIRQKNKVRAELYISGINAKAFLGLLRQEKEAIENELGHPLEWEELPAGRDSRVSCYLEGADPEDEDDWPRQHVWLATRLNDMHKVFAERVRTLDANSWQPDEQIKPVTASEA